MTGLVVVQLAAQLLLKGSMKELWGMFFTLQIICYLSQYSITIPSNSDMFRDEFTKVIEFSLLEPEPLIKLFYPEFDLMEFIKGGKVMVTDKDQDASVLKDMKIYLFIAAGAVFVVLTLLIFKLVQRFRAKIEEKLNDAKKKFMWNGMIQSIDITYIEILLTVGTQFSMYLKGSEF